MDKLERMARAICRARGSDPDAKDGQLLNVVGFGQRPAANPTEPNWRYYVDDAQAFIAAHEALTSGGENGELTRMRGELGGVADWTKDIK